MFLRLIINVQSHLRKFSQYSFQQIEVGRGRGVLDLSKGASVRPIIILKLLINNMEIALGF
jgi:hypothetical protein